MMTILDYLFVVIFAGILPVLSWKQCRDLLQNPQDLIALNRRTYYKSTIIVQWILCIGLLLLWLTERRSWNSLGFTFETGWGLVIGAAITIAVLLFFFRQLQQARGPDQEVKEVFKQEFGDTLPFLPHDKGDLKLFYAVSATAGIVEEILFRGYLIWFLTQITPLWVAAIAAIFLFALAHSYQGLKQFPMLLGISTILMVVFLVSGSLWLPMILHVVGDILQGKLAYTVVGDDDVAVDIAQ